MEVIDLSHTEVVKIDGEAFAECVALADISFPSTIPTFGVKVFDRCTELSRTMETLDNEKVFAFFQDQASSLPFSYFARSPVSALDDLKTLPPPAVPFRRMASGDTPLHCRSRSSAWPRGGGPQSTTPNRSRCCWRSQQSRVRGCRS